MLSKRAKPWDASELSANKRLKQNIRHLFGSNRLSGPETQELINDAAAAGVSVADLPAPTCDPKDKHMAQKLRRRLLRRCQWPSDYVCKIRMLNRTTEAEELVDIAILNPHEILDMLWALGDETLLLDVSMMDPLTLENLRENERSTGIRMQGFAIHADGVPCNWDRSESAEVVSVSLPGLGGKWKNLRIPLTALPHSMIGPNTWDDFMEVIAWSVTCAWHGVNPDKRHDGTPFNASDAHRKRKIGKRLRCCSCLVEVGGDWKMLAETFHFPRWNSKEGVCWSCPCKLDEATFVWHACSA